MKHFWLIVGPLLLLLGCAAEPIPVRTLPQDLALAWHPDGQTIAVQHEGVESPSGVYLTHVGDPARQLVVANGSSPDWNPDGTQLVVSRGGQILRLVVSTGELIPISAADAFTSLPAWSPDGRWIAFSSNGGDSHAPPDLWLADMLSGAPPYRVPLGGPPRDEMFEKDWSPSSDRLVISVAGRPQRLFLTDITGRDTTYLSIGSADARMPSWRPSGEWIAYVQTKDKSADLWLVRPDGSDNHLLIRRAAYPAWSPDGQRIAFSRPTDSATALWSVKFDGSDLQQLTFP